MLNAAIDQRHAIFSVVLALAMAAVVGGALYFEYVLGYLPCYLCLLQRTPYYIGVPVALVAAAAAWLRWPGCITRGGLVIVSLLMAYGAALSAYHAGVEWGWWAGPADCGAGTSTGIINDATDLLGAIDAVTPPSCDEAALRILGLSLAGWNVFLSLALAVFAFRVQQIENEA